MAKYGKKAQQKVSEAMHERKRGTLRSGRSGKKVTNPKQAIAIGLSEARREGGKVPSKKSSTKKSSASKSSSKKSSPKKSSPKSGAKKTARKSSAKKSAKSSARRRNRSS